MWRVPPRSCTEFKVTLATKDAAIWLQEAIRLRMVWGDWFTMSSVTTTADVQVLVHDQLKSALQEHWMQSLGA
jgi:hypothetical protein